MKKDKKIIMNMIHYNLNYLQIVLNPHPFFIIQFLPFVISVFLYVLYSLISFFFFSSFYFVFLTFYYSIKIVNFCLVNSFFWFLIFILELNYLLLVAMDLMQIHLQHNYYFQKEICFAKKIDLVFHRLPFKLYNHLKFLHMN